MASGDLLLHPVRLRIVQQFLGGQELTTAALRERLGDVPVASLYRHIGRLLDAGVLEVVSQRAVRGSTERTYMLRAEAAVVGPEEAAAMSVDDHRRAFIVFVAGLLDDFERYLAGGGDPGRDLVGYRQVGLHLRDDELEALIAELNAVLVRRLDLGPDEGRRLRVLTTILLPRDDL